MDRIDDIQRSLDQLCTQPYGPTSMSPVHVPRHAVPIPGAVDEINWKLDQLRFHPVPSSPLPQQQLTESPKLINLRGTASPTPLVSLRGDSADSIVNIQKRAAEDTMAAEQQEEAAAAASAAAAEAAAAASAAAEEEAAAARAAAGLGPKWLVIDTDAGVDDAVALVTALTAAQSYGCVILCPQPCCHPLCTGTS